MSAVNTCVSENAQFSIGQALAGEYSFFENPELALLSYQAFGFHVEKNLLSARECDDVISNAYLLKAAVSGDLKPFMMPHRENDYFLEMMKNQKCVSIVEALIRGKAVGLQTKFFYCEPKTGGFSIHQDNFYVQAPMNQFVSAWVALVDTSPENGGLNIYPGAHIEGELPVQKPQIDHGIDVDPNAHTIECIVPEKYKSISVSVPKGAALFIHAHLPHGSGANHSSSNRYVLLNTYCRQGASFRKGEYAKREAIELA
jgi:hypothetical protein